MHLTRQQRDRARELVARAGRDGWEEVGGEDSGGGSVLVRRGSANPAVETARCAYLLDEPGFPAPEMLRLTVRLDGSPEADGEGDRVIELAGVVPSEDKDRGTWFGGFVELLLAGPAMIASGAAAPWLDRIRRATKTYAREAGGEWLSLGRGPGRTKTPAEDPAATPLLAALTTDPAPVVAGVTPAAEGPRQRARMWAEAMNREGWRAAPRRANRRDLAVEVLAEFTFKHPDGPRQRCAYVLTGHPRLPEALWWRSDQPYYWLRKSDLLVDLCGLDDPELPGRVVNADPAAKALQLAEILVRTAPRVGDREGAMSALQALTTVASVHDRGWKLPDPVYVFDQPTRLPRTAARPLAEAVAALNGAPEDGELWLETGFAAYDARLPHMANVAFQRAAALGAGGGMPRLWHASLLIHHDPHGALRELDVAAADGEVTGAARHLQAVIHERVLGNPQAALESFAQATAEDPDYADGWISRGLLMLRNGMRDDAAQVFTAALERHSRGVLWYSLACVHALNGESDAALDGVERAVRLEPKLVRGIRRDEDFSAIRDHPRFEALSALAAEFEAPYHRAIRAALRPDGRDHTAPPMDAEAALAAVERLRDTYSNYVPSQVEPTRLRPAVSEPLLRSILTAVGLPSSMGAFTVDYDLSNPEGAPRQHEGKSFYDGTVPDGFGGLFILGRLGESGLDETHVTVDGETGELFLTGRDHSVRYLAPDLATFLVDLCEDAGERQWQIAPGGLDRLDDVSEIRDGRLGLVVEGLDSDDQERLLGFLTRHGALLHHLTVKRFHLTHADYSDFDFAARCPNLRSLDLHGPTVNESVFAHPTLERFSLKEGYYKGKRDIRIGTRADADGRDGARLRGVSFADCLVEADTLVVGPYSVLQTFNNSIDEDYGGVFPEHLEFAGCEDLRSIYINADAAYWELTLRGHLPKLKEISQDANPYGGFTSTVVEASPADEARYERLIKRGKDFTKRW